MGLHRDYYRGYQGGYEEFRLWLNLQSDSEHPVFASNLGLRAYSSLPACHTVESSQEGGHMLWHIACRYCLGATAVVNCCHAEASASKFCVSARILHNPEQKRVFLCCSCRVSSRGDRRLKGGTVMGNPHHLLRVYEVD